MTRASARGRTKCVFSKLRSAIIQKVCAIALLENETGDSFSVSKQVKYFSGHPPMDEAFHWGLRWVAGRK